ncbi:MAG: hypothetical protein WCP91_03725 [Candidatus Berkelbacteria bacterium]
MFDFFRKPIFLIIMAAALIVAGIWAYVSNRKSQTAATTTSTTSTTATTTTTDTTADISNLTNIDPAVVNDAINAQLTLADAKAAEVDKKLVLSAIEVDLPGALERGSGISYYIYTTTGDKNNNWVIGISNADSKFVRSWTSKADYMTGVTAINRSNLKKNYVAAIQSAEKGEGKIFREAGTLTAAKLILKNADPNNWLYWFVEYDASANQKQFKVDASTGALVTDSSNL